MALGVGKGVGSIGGFAGRKVGLIKKKDKSGKEVLLPVNQADGLLDSPTADGGFNVSAPPQTSTIVDGQLAPPIPAPGSPKIGANNGAAAEGGTLSVTVLGIKDLKGGEKGAPKPYVQLKMGSRSYKTDHIKGSEAEW